jgi:NADH dehydrogenase [ubiquinone] 1 alpha subcomplex assembly factor 7
VSAFARALAATIAANGPMRLDRWMAACVSEYYARDNTLGRDFTTAPEISQVFGELIGLWAADLWQRAGRPDPVHLAELGPGRGQLMADAWRATRGVPGFHMAARVHLMETSPVLRAAQADRMAHAHFHEDVDTLPDGPLLLVANEFVDALPIRQFVRTASGWHDRAVGVTAEGFAPVIGDPAPEGAVPETFANAAQSAIYEDRPAARALMATLDRRLARHGGAALVIDYGHTRAGLGDTLQAIRAGARVNPFTHPGEADLTAHVDFETLQSPRTTTVIHGPIPQAQFLRRLGLTQRTHALARANPDQAAALHAAAARLTAPAQMGTLFQVLALTAPDWPTPAGFIP